MMLENRTYRCIYRLAYLLYVCLEEILNCRSRYIYFRVLIEMPVYVCSRTSFIPRSEALIK